jgi:hypothetical protein
MTSIYYKVTECLEDYLMMVELVAASYAIV